MTKPNSPWRPWETAPKTGTVILAAWKDQGRWSVDACCWEHNKWMWRGCRLGAQPEFWRERPPGPYETPENADLVEACTIAVAFLRRITDPGPPVGIAGLEDAVASLEAASKGGPMPELSITVDAKCAECGKSLNSTATRGRYGGFDMVVEACIDCPAEARLEGRDEDPDA